MLYSLECNMYTLNVHRITLFPQLSKQLYWVLPWNLDHLVKTIRVVLFIWKTFIYLKQCLWFADYCRHNSDMFRTQGNVKGEHSFCCYVSSCQVTTSDQSKVCKVLFSGFSRSHLLCKCASWRTYMYIYFNSWNPELRFGQCWKNFKAGHTKNSHIFDIFSHCCMRYWWVIQYNT